MSHTAYREEHPVPAILMHWLHVIAMFALIISGLYIHSPFFPGGMGLMRALHTVFMWVLIIVLIARIIWAFVGRSAAPGSREVVPDRRHFGWQRENRGTFGRTLGYYLFIRKRPPAGGKFNPLQKGTYSFWILLIIAQAITGFALWEPTQPALRPLIYLLGGLQYTRMWHYLIMWLFIITTLVHIYLSALHREQMRLMFTGRETTGHGADYETSSRRVVT